jgi:hypothetical protein
MHEAVHRESQLLDTTGQYCLGGTAACEWPCMHPVHVVQVASPIAHMYLVWQRTSWRCVVLQPYRRQGCSYIRAQQHGAGKLQALCYHSLGSLAASTIYLLHHSLLNAAGVE